MDLITIASEIKKKIDELEKMRPVIRERSDKKTSAIVEYQKAIAKTIIKLKQGEPFELDGVKIDDKIPITLIKEVAKGICWNESLELEKSESLYKALLVNLEVTMAQLNAFQTLNRYLDKA